MLVLIFASIFIEQGFSAPQANVSEPDFSYHPEKSLRNVKVLNLSESCYLPECLDLSLNKNNNIAVFSSLQNYEVNATPVNETKYPWIARVVHSRTADIPHLCTAACIDSGVFITAARCLYALKANYTSVIYRGKHLRVLAFVLPSETTKQGYDDIGFIVINIKNVKGTWPIIELFREVNRTDEVYHWFSNIDYLYGNLDGKVVGYATKKGALRSPEQRFNLTELKVYVGLDICPNILSRSEKTIKGFVVPCYHSCSFSQVLKNSAQCKNYHGVEGGIIFDTFTGKLIGVATWGSYYPKHELPVGFSFANSAPFYSDYRCARKIRDDNGELVTKGYYQTLCQA